MQKGGKWSTVAFSMGKRAFFFAVFSATTSFTSPECALTDHVAFVYVDCSARTSIKTRVKKIGRVFQ